MLDDKFHELMPPCHTNGVSPELWYVEAIHSSLFLLNDKHGILGTTARPIETFYFPTLVDAFCEMSSYYTFHTKPFLYHAEYVKAIQDACADGLATLAARRGTTDETQSEIMEFE